MEWIEILKCPISGNNLRTLTSEEVSGLNDQINAGKIFQADGNSFREKIENGLITVNGEYIYPIIKDIVLLLRDLAIVDSIDKVIKDTISDDKKLVQNFYNQRGWHTDESGNY